MAFSELANWDGNLTRKRAFPTVTASRASMSKTAKKPEAMASGSTLRSFTKTLSNGIKLEGGDKIAMKAETRRHRTTSYSKGEGLLVSLILRALERHSFGHQSTFSL